MASRRVIRRVVPHEPDTFDEQLWPIGVALVVLGAFLAGMVLSLMRLDDPRVLHNGATYLAAIPILIGLWMWLATRIDRRWMRRAVMFSLIVSLAINICLLTLTGWTRLVAPRATQKQVAKNARQRQEVTVPEAWVLPTPKDQVRKQWETPVPVETPDQPTEPETRESVPEPLVPRETREPTSVEQSPQEVRPQTRERREIAETIPRQSDSSSMMRRQVSDQPPRAGQLVAPTPVQPPRTELSEVPAASQMAIEPAPTNLARQTEPSAMERSAMNLPHADMSMSSPRIARAVTHDPVANNAPATDTRRSPALSSARSRLPRTADTQPPTLNKRAVPQEENTSVAARSAATLADEPAPVAATAISRAEIGVAGIGRSPNLQMNLADSLGSSPRAADLARRDTPAEIPGAAVRQTPGLPGRSGRVRDDRLLPPTSTNVRDVPIPSDSGMLQSIDIVASEAAAPEKSGTNSTATEIQPDGGTSNWDLGPAALAHGQVRGKLASGGGLPSLSDGDAGPLLARQSPGAANGPSGSLQVDTVNIPQAADATDVLPVDQPTPAEFTAGRDGTVDDIGESLSSSIESHTISPGDRDHGVSGGGTYAASPRKAEVRGDEDGPSLDANRTDTPFDPRKEIGGPLAVNTSVAPTVVSAGDANATGSPTVDPEVDELLGGLQDGTAIRRDESTLASDRDAPPGPAGISVRAEQDAGLAIARSDALSDSLEPQHSRFRRRDIGGPIVTNTKADMSVAAFNRRERRFGELKPGGPGQPPAKTEDAIELGLVFLSRHQSADGRWSLDRFAAEHEYAEQERTSLRSDTAATGLGLLSFLGAGYHHQDDKYQEVVRGALQHLLAHQSDDGNLYVADDAESARSVALYSHGIAALALCEAYGMTQDPELKEPAQRALDYIVAAQHKRLGGWRYAPGLETDTSVSGWMVMALKSGELAELSVPPETYDKVARWLDFAQASGRERHLYRYNPLAPDNELQRHGRTPTHVITSVGLLSRMYLGWRRDNPWMQRGSDYLLENLPEIGSSNDPRRDTYYWYYATQVMFHMGGERWETWNARLHPLLIESQQTDGPLAGSWNPQQPVPDRWARHAGRLYVTTMNLLSLEVYYRHLPLYEETAR